MNKWTLFITLLISAMSGCGNTDFEHEPAFYSTRFEIGNDGDFAYVGRVMQEAIEAGCGLLGHERPIYKMVGGSEEYFYLFQSHAFDGELRTGAIMHTSVGQTRGLVVEVFLSGFDGDTEANECRDAIELQFQNLAAKSAR